ncbi:uncharacterized protein [Dendropsophus ebraccatus]|uniref:uncharacterized protein n=1 Tax=Dendropsophus ebraccatus TaxID=150705 RepID=UPI003831461E
MSEPRRVPTPAPRTRSVGGRGIQRPTEGIPSEVQGLRRSTRMCSDASPAAPEPEVTKGSRKATASCGTTSARSSGTTMETSQENLCSDTPPGARLSAHEGVEEDWGVQRSQETGQSYGLRIAASLCGYEEARNQLYKLQEEVCAVKALMDTAAKQQKAELTAKMKCLKVDIKKLMKKRTFILENSGPFKEKLQNDDRFAQTEREKRRGLRGLQPESRVEEEGDAAEVRDVEPNPPRGPQQQTPYSGLPAGQAALSSSRGSGDESNTSYQGGALMAQIQLLESPGRLQDFVFGDELPEEAPGRKTKVKTTKLQEQRSSSSLLAPVDNEVQGVLPPSCRAALLKLFLLEPHPTDQGNARASPH